MTQAERIMKLVEKMIHQAEGQVRGAGINWEKIQESILETALKEWYESTEMTDRRGGALEAFQIPQRKTIYLDSELSPPWYLWNREKEEKEPIQENSLIGELQGIEVKSQDYKGKAMKKMIVKFKNYQIKSGLTTTWTKGFVFSLFNTLNTTGKLPQIIRLVPTQGVDKVVLCNIYTEKGERLQRTEKWMKWPIEYQEKDWETFIYKGVEKINQFLGYIQEEIEEEEEDVAF